MSLTAYTARMIRTLSCRCDHALLCHRRACPGDRRARKGPARRRRSRHLVDGGDGSADFRVLRDWAEPGAVRRMHNHADATYHVFTLLTGQLTLTVEGQEPVDVKAGDVLELKGGAMHTFKNTGTVTATIVEVFGKAAEAEAVACVPKAVGGR